MKIEMDAGSKEWIESKGNQLTVKTLEGKSLLCSWGAGTGGCAWKTKDFEQLS